MFERFSKSDMAEMGGVGFIVGPMVRFNCYKQPDIFQNWSGEIFDSFLQAIFIHLNRSIDLPSTQVLFFYFEISQPLRG
jgi:hypothetical protein